MKNNSEIRESLNKQRSLLNLLKTVSTDSVTPLDIEKIKKILEILIKEAFN